MEWIIFILYEINGCSSKTIANKILFQNHVDLQQQYFSNGLTTQSVQFWWIYDCTDKPGCLVRWAHIKIPQLTAVQLGNIDKSAILLVQTAITLVNMKYHCNLKYVINLFSSFLFFFPFTFISYFTFIPGVRSSFFTFFKKGDSVQVVVLFTTLVSR